MTRHVFGVGDARRLTTVSDHSIQLIVTSPPYPMISMWDAVFAQMDPEVAVALANDDGQSAFEAMHRQLDRCWAECVRVLIPGGFFCINVGDATRTIAGQFRLYPNHARIVAAVEALGCTNLPSVIWRKPTNAPTKFLGSGMLPAGAYVTLEHEHILIFRKGTKRRFSDSEIRRRSALFWEERNAWFSDLWQLTGTRQERGSGDSARLLGAEAQRRSAAFPLEIAFRLMLMYSVLGDTVLDPFAGTGTCLAVAAALGRNSVAIDSDPAIVAGAPGNIERLFAGAVDRARRRIVEHRAFVESQPADRCRHRNHHLGLPVVTSQETDLVPDHARRIRTIGDGVFEAE